MRPIYKGSWPLTAKRKLKQAFTDPTKAISILKKRTGGYCHLCEMKTPSLTIEHIFSQIKYPRLKAHWDNFLLICIYCNSRKGKNELLTPYRKNYYWTHLNNTAIAFQYPISNYCIIQPNKLLTTEQRRKANNLIDIYKLNSITTKEGDEDTRHKERLEALSKAINRIIEYKTNKCTVSAIIDIVVAFFLFGMKYSKMRLLFYKN